MHTIVIIVDMFYSISSSSPVQVHSSKLATGMVPTPKYLSTATPSFDFYHFKQALIILNGLSLKKKLEVETYDASFFQMNMHIISCKPLHT